MRIGLFGFTTAHENMGCQALTYSFLNVLKTFVTKEKDCIVIFAYSTSMGRLKEDFPDLPIECCKISLKKERKNFFSNLKSCDVIFDETFGDGFSDIYFTKSAYKDAIIKNIINMYGLKLVLTPQTYGPFYHKTLEKISAKAIKGAYRVYARDSISANYAYKISKREVRSTVDLAFALTYEHFTLDGDKIRIGLNVSGLLWKGGFDQNNQFGLKTDYQVYCKRIVEYFDKEGYEVHLIPHVTTAGDKNRIIPDGDIEACEELHRLYSFTQMAPAYDSPIKVKEYISAMDYFVGARMHSTIAAFSSGVVTIPFAYSRKFQGVFNDLNYPVFVDGKVLNTEEAIKKTVEFIKSAGELKSKQNEALKTIRVRLNYFKKEVEEILKNVD